MHGMICAIMKIDGENVRHWLKRVDLNVFFLIKESILIFKLDEPKGYTGIRFSLIYLTMLILISLNFGNRLARLV